VIFALLDSPRATGAYRLILRPGSDTVVDVKAQMFLRDKVSKLGMPADQHVPVRRQPAVQSPQLPSSCTTPAACRSMPATASGSGVR
jgi:hypothetical protein